MLVSLGEQEDVEGVRETLRGRPKHAGTAMMRRPFVSLMDGATSTSLKSLTCATKMDHVFPRRSPVLSPGSQPDFSYSENEYTDTQICV